MGYCNHKVMGQWRYTNCSKTAKYDPDENGKPTRCGMHSKAAQERRQKEKDEREEAAIRSYRRKRAADAVREKITALDRSAVKLLRLIADGYSDPRALAEAFFTRKEMLQKEWEYVNDWQRTDDEIKQFLNQQEGVQA